MMWKRIPQLEKYILYSALILSAGHLSLIAYASLKLGVTVPDCVDNPESFAQPSFNQIGDKHYEVHFVGKMWNFQPNFLKLPTGSTLDVYYSTADVVHGLFIENTNVNLMAVPGAVAKATVRFEKPGRYDVFCHEYCGAGHQNMNAVIHIQGGVEAEVAGLDSAALIAEAASPEQGLEKASASNTSVHAQNPAQILTAKGCQACHSLDGKVGVGPSFKGLYGSKVSLNDGRTVTVDDAYLRESIREPSKDVVKGFNPLMPQIPLTDEELTAIIEQIKTTK